jgi:hypothetical protein
MEISWNLFVFFWYLYYYYYTYSLYILPGLIYNFIGTLTYILKNIPCTGYYVEFLGCIPKQLKNIYLVLLYVAIIQQNLLAQKHYV